MSNREIVIQRERAWHEQAASHRYRLDATLYGAPAFDTVVQAGVAFLQPTKGEQVLELGCGEGKEVSHCLQLGLRVVGIDLSFTQLSRTQALAKAQCPTTCLMLVQANAEALPFAADPFRIIYGKAILHHLILTEPLRRYSGSCVPMGARLLLNP
jgi:ubiquinone/menaquinone biosynthesis C-methylase UbiE